MEEKDKEKVIEANNFSSFNPAQTLDWIKGRKVVGF